MVALGLLGEDVYGTTRIQSVTGFQRFAVEATPSTKVPTPLSTVNVHRDVFSNPEAP